MQDTQQTKDWLCQQGHHRYSSMRGNFKRCTNCGHTTYNSLRRPVRTTSRFMAHDMFKTPLPTRSNIALASIVIISRQGVAS